MLQSEDLPYSGTKTSQDIEVYILASLDALFPYAKLILTGWALNFLRSGFMKRILIFTMVLFVLLLGCGCSADDKNSVTVTVEIECSDILSNYDMLDESLRDEKYVPSDGIILEKTEITVNEGDGALEALSAIAKKSDIHTDISDGYAKGINYIYEKSCGEMSGWVYEVNNEPVMTAYSVSEGDLITWTYVCDFSAFGE